MKEFTISCGSEKKRPPRYVGQLSILRGGLGILDISTQLNSIKKMDSKVTKSHQCSLKDLLPYRLNLILNTNQGLALFRQIQILRSNRRKNFQKQNNEDFFIQ